MVEQRSPKPSVACSSRVSPAKPHVLPHGETWGFSISETATRTNTGLPKKLRKQVFWEKEKQTKRSCGWRLRRTHKAAFVSTQSRLPCHTEMRKLFYSHFPTVFQIAYAIFISFQRTFSVVD